MKQALESKTLRKPAALLAIAAGDATAQEEQTARRIPLIREQVRSVGTLAARVEAFEIETILAELKDHGYNVAETARALGLERSHLYKKCNQLGIEVDKLRGSSTMS